MMDFGNASIDSQPSFGGSYDSASSIRERDETYNSLQDRLKVLLKTQKRNEKLKQYIEEAKKKTEQHQKYAKQLEEQLNEIINNLGLSLDSSLSTILEKIKSMNESQMLFLEISDIINFSNNTDKKSVISIIKENTIFRQAISEILGQNKSTDELISDIKQLKKTKIESDSALKELGTNNFEYLVENHKQAEKHQRQICSLLDVKSETERNLRHKSIISAIKDLKSKPSEILTELGQLISPNFTEKVEDPQDIKNMIIDLKQKSSKLSKQVEKLNSELQSDKNSLSQFHFSTVDDVTSIISNLLTILNIKSPSMIQAEISKNFSEKNELKSLVKSATDELQKTKSKLKTKEDEYEESQTKINDFQKKYQKIENDKNLLQSSIKDKDEEIESLKSLLQAEKGNVKIKFDEFNDQIMSLKTDLHKMQSKNEEAEMKNQELSSELDHLRDEFESTKKSLKEQISLKNESIEKVADFQNQTETLTAELKKVQQNFDSMKESKENVEKVVAQFQSQSNNIQKILKIGDSSQISSQIQKLIYEEDELKRINNELTKERQTIAKMLNLGNESSISEAITDLLENQAEQKAENQDLTQKISAVASFLNIPNPQAVTLSTIQKTIRNLQKEAETTQNEKAKLKAENDSLNQKYEVLLDTQNEIQKSLNMDTFKSSNELIKAVSENEDIISKSCNKLNVNRKDLFEKIKSNDEIISQLCSELNTDESNLVKTVLNHKKSIGKTAEILNASGSSIERVVEENNELLNSICQTMNCSRENVADEIAKNSQVLNNLLQISNSGQVDQITSEFSEMKKNHEKASQVLNELMDKLHINSIDKVSSAVSNLQKDSEKASSLEKKSSEISNLLKIQNGNDSDDIKHSIQNVLSENKRLNDTMSRIQTIMKSTDILNSITLMSTIFNSIQKMLPKSIDTNEIPTIFGRYKNDSESYGKIQKLFPSTDPISEIETIQKEMNEIYSIFGLKKFEDPIEFIKMNNDFVKSIFEIVNDSSLNSSRSNRNSPRKNRNTGAAPSSINNHELIESVRKTFNEYREIMNLLNTDSPLKVVRSIVDQKKEISKFINLDQDEDQTAEIKKVVDLKNNLSKLLDANEASEILSSVQKQKQTNKDLFSILNVEDSNQLLSKASQLAEVESLLKKVCPDENDLKEVILKIEKEKKLLCDVITKISNIVNSSNSLNSSNSSNASNQSSHSDKSRGFNHRQVVRKVEKLANIKDEVCQLLNCTENSIVDQVRSMKDELDGLNEIFNSEVNGSGQSKLIQSAKNDKQTLKNLARAVDVKNYSEILPKVDQYKNEIEELHEKLNQTEKFKSNLNRIFETSQYSSPSSIEKKAQQFKSKINQFNDLLSLLNCDEDEVNLVMSNLLSSTNSSSIHDVSDYISALKEKIDKLTSKIQKDNTFLSEFLSDGEMNGQFMNSDNLVQFTINKLKQKNNSLEEKVDNYDREMNKLANFIKNTNNRHYSFDEISKIFRTHQDQLKQMRTLFSSDGHSSEIQTTFQKVEQMHLKLRETANELSKSQQIINQKDFEISGILSACNASSPEFAIDIIKALKKQISELNKEVAELRMCQTVEQSFQLFEKKEKQVFSAIATKLNEINNLLHGLLSLIETGRNQKAEMKKLIEGALLESINLRETLEANEEKWILFGNKKKIVKKSTLSDEIRIRKKELVQQKRKVDKAECAIYNQQDQQTQQKRRPFTLL